MHTDTLQEHINNFVKSTKTLTGDELMHAKATFNKYVESATHSLDAVGCSISERAKTSVKASNEYAHAHPWRLAAISSGILLIGLGVSRIKKNKCSNC